MSITANQVLQFRLRAHHLDRKRPLSHLEDVAGACGLQNSPPGAWETALFFRLEGCTRAHLESALYQEKRLLQAWSYRGAPVVFPATQSAVFLSALAAHEGEAPWIYTRGISLALDALQLNFETLLAHTVQAAALLDNRAIVRKEALDRALAQAIEPDLPASRLAAWRAPSMYDTKGGGQTVGEAAVSFLLRPCSFLGRVVFGERQGACPTFTSYRNWLGRELTDIPDASQALARKFLHCYGPTTPGALETWLGCSPRQAKRIWHSVEDEIEPVLLNDKRRYILAQDQAALAVPADDAGTIRLLGPHDPYLDARDRELLLPDAAQRKRIWKTVGNPGVILKDGKIAGQWTAKSQSHQMSATYSLFEPCSTAQIAAIQQEIEAYASFRGLQLATLSEV